MIDPDGLLLRARTSLGTSPGRPADVNLRGGVIDAYYALLHEVTLHAARRALGNCDARQVECMKLRRRYTHEALTSAFEDLSAGNTKQIAPELLLCRRSNDILDIANGFPDLRKERERASYDHRAAFTKESSTLIVDQADDLVAKLRRSVPTNDGKTLVTILNVYCL